MNPYNLRIGDRLIRSKGLVSKHHGIYVGVRNGIHCVAENQRGFGVQFISLTQFVNESHGEFIIKDFTGSEYARAQIIPRIEALIGTSYNLVNFNCEHFAELIQNGKAVSAQVGAAIVIGLALLGYWAFKGE